MTTATLGGDFVSHQLYALVQKEMAAKAKGGSSSCGSRYLRTQSSVFRSSLNSLIKRLNGTTPNYVRCIKTNAVKKKNLVFLQHPCV